MAEHLYTYDDPPSKRDLTRICELLRNDGVIAYPTDVNWAFGCDARSKKAIDRIRRLKPGRPESQPFSLICANISMASQFGFIDNATYRLLKKILPGPYTVIIERTKSISRQLNDKRKAVGIRVPDCQFLLSLVTHLESPLVATSIPQKQGDLPFCFGYQIDETFGHALDMVLDLGRELVGSESTIVDFTGENPKVIREGAGDSSLFL